MLGKTNVCGGSGEKSVKIHATNGTIVYYDDKTISNPKWLGFTAKKDTKMKCFVKHNVGSSNTWWAEIYVNGKLMTRVITTYENYKGFNLQLSKGDVVTWIVEQSRTNAFSYFAFWDDEN